MMYLLLWLKICIIKCKYIKKVDGLHNVNENLDIIDILEIVDKSKYEIIIWYSNGKILKLKRIS